MSDITFSPTSTIFEQREALLEEWTPDELVGRDEELQKYHAALQPVINNETPSNIFLYGKSGVGKTAATRYLLSALERDASDVDGLDLSTVEVNCDGLNSSYQAAVAIVNTLRDPANQISNTGYPQASVYQFLFEALDDLGGTVLIVLDEVDHIEDDSLLYKLPRARSNGDISDAKLGVIGISNDLDFRNQLSSKVRSSLCEKEVSFSAYNANELQLVLKQREAVAFKDDVIDDGVIEMCAAYGAKDSGDARQALDLLLEAGDLAREYDDELVTEHHVSEARQRLQTDQVVEGIRNYSEHGQLVLYALTGLAEDGDTPARTRDILGAYQELARGEGLDPVSERSVRDYLGELTQLGIISSTEYNRGKGGGKYKEFELEQSISSIKTGLSELLKTNP
ncbi:orc1/cdc6 family replication initiation protein [Haloarcula rubripromontorii]|uniref:ORC1-type DNA replication protein n=1 Tax=Haloarcula rubripromontorii TaxID=1705562 RepID=A0A0N0U914_9EURY|nr:orc1/cdc6 family replication initiation protein [Haloarcula rubripromontorii]KOX92460.1 cell division control protein Cdc6 [Haloarcula rubripromontorii]NLV05970.1 AAA family ATPase [Haloarcula rubripromontorii]